jgi:dUTP pyrophosphatase
MTFYVSNLNNNAIIPSRATRGSAGYDLSACENSIIPARGWEMVNTGIAIQIPINCYARVAPRSGLALKKGLDVGAGVVDSDYRDAIRVILFNHSDNDFVINIGDRIAQLIFEKIYTPELNIITQAEYNLQLTCSERGIGGFGSTGN